MSNAPSHLQDAQTILSDNGFASGTVWYHGTSSALLESILANGLKRSGDKSMKQAAKQTMATIGNDYTESVEPVFLTPSKEVAHYWASQTVRDRSVRVEGVETPVVVALTLPEALNAKVKPDVGAASLLLLKEGEAYLAYIAGLYQQAQLSAPSIDLMNADRLEFLNKLGMAYLSQDVSAEHVSLVSE